jgi:hypothetical protein
MKFIVAYYASGNKKARDQGPYSKEFVLAYFCKEKSCEITIRA